MENIRFCWQSTNLLSFEAARSSGDLEKSQLNHKLRWRPIGPSRLPPRTPSQANGQSSISIDLTGTTVLLISRRLEGLARVSKGLE